MTVLIEAADAQAWAETSKLTIDAAKLIEQTALVEQAGTHVIARLATVYDVTDDWSSPSATPALVKSVIACFFVGWYYEKVHSEDDPESIYGQRLLDLAEKALASLMDGSAELVELGDDDQPSITDPAETSDDLDDPVFTMGAVF